MLSVLNEKIDNLNINQTNSKEGGKDPVKKNFEENIEEEINDAPSTEVFDGEEGGDGTDDGVDYYEDPVDETEDSNDETVNDGESNPEPSDDGDEGSDEDDEESGIPLGQRDDDDTADSKKYSVEVTINTDNGKKTFSTMMEKLNALYELVNSTYSDADNDIYSVDADEEKKVVEMHQWFGGKHYRQSYSVKKDVYSLVGDRVETYAKYLTEDEIKSLENMKANYSSIETELAQYKAEPEKEAILGKECYAQISEEEAFKKLADKETHFSMSVDEVQAEADRILLEYAKHNKIEFSSDESEKKSVGMKLFGNPEKKKTAGKSRYGGIFNK